MLRYFAIVLLSVLIILLLFAASGCTFHFKAQELEFENEATRNFNLDGVDLFGVPLLRCSHPGPIPFDASLPKTYAFK